MTTRRRKAWLVAAFAASLAVSAFIFVWIPTEQSKLDAVAAGAEQAVRDLDAEYKAALGGQPAYFGYVIQGHSDPQSIRSRMHDVAILVLSADLVRACDWRKERGVLDGDGSQYIYLRKDTGQQVLILNVELARCTRFSAAVKISHAVGGATYCLSRWPGQPWRVTSKKDVYQIVS